MPYTDKDVQDIKVEGLAKDAGRCCTKQDNAGPERSQLGQLHPCKQSEVHTIKCKQSIAHNQMQAVKCELIAGAR